jgi:6,7-dimethyl-8-ribityllumazine synthase
MEPDRVTEATHRLAPPRPETSGEGALVGSHEGRHLRIAVVCARYNDEITLRLLEGAQSKLDECGVLAEHRVVAWVPGSFELPLAAQSLAHTGAFDAVVCLGSVIRGATAHFDFVAGECAAGLQRVQLETNLPIVFGVLTTENLEQALERSGGAVGNKGCEAVVTAVEMANVLKDVSLAGAALRSRGRPAPA